MSIPFANLRHSLSAVVLLTVIAGCSSAQYSQSLPAEFAQKPSALTSVSTLSGQAETTAVPSTTLFTSTEAASQQNDCDTLQRTNQKNECDQLDTSVANQQLDQVYRKLVSQVGGASREKLINSQQAWVSFVEAQCGFETRGFEDGTQSSPLYERCLKQLIQQRIQELKGDLGSSR